MRTTSSLESFHSALNRSMAKHGSFFEFVEGLKLHESRKANDLYNILHDHSPITPFTNRHKQVQMREEIIRRNTKALTDGKMTTKSFLEALTEELRK